MANGQRRSSSAPRTCRVAFAITAVNVTPRGGARGPLRRRRRAPHSLHAEHGDVRAATAHAGGVVPELDLTQAPFADDSVPTGFRFEGNLDFGVAARRCGSNDGSDAVGMLPDAGPLGAARQSDEGDAPRSQVLLVADAAVGREQQLEPCRFRGVQERAIAQCVPAPGLRRVDCVPGQRTRQSLRRAVVKEDEYRQGRGPPEGS